MSLFVDIAIGAPFAGQDQRGKVLVYNGNKRGLNTKPSQILQGVWASQAVPSGFGFTLRGDSDIDKNDYPGKLFFLFPRERPLPGERPCSGKRVKCQRLSLQTGEGQASPPHRCSVCASRVTFRRNRRQTKQTLPFLSRKARRLFKKKTSLDIKLVSSATKVFM